MEGSVHLVACILMLFLSCTCAFNIDTRQPIIKTLPAPDSAQTDGLFGYSLVLHQIATVADGDMMGALDNTRIVVSAPKLTVPGSLVDRTGAVYTCPINQGDCGGLMGTGSGSDRRLYDTDANGNEEMKSEQFLGGSMASNGDRFIVCAHRFANQRSEDLATPVGRCYATTNQALREFQTLEPCPIDNAERTDNFNTGSGGVCVAGTSSVIMDNGNYGLGAPGYFGLRGLVIRITPNGDEERQDFMQGTMRDSYQGYATTAGNFRTMSSQDFAVSVPKFQNYFGSVNIIDGDDLSLVSQPDLRGEQMGEYYGFSLLRANLIGDELDELLVGAPMYRANVTEPETGRVFIYNNVDGSLTFLRAIEGFNNFSRFGYAMANLGDINGDGFDDVAISAPFTSSFLNASGSVYIYHSSPQTLTPTPQQVIVGSELSLMRNLSSLRGFGTSLASGVDVDENSFNDLAIGSFLTQEVFLLRTRPLAVVTQSLAAPLIIDLDTTSCDLGSTNYSCFNVMACARYTGDGVTNSISFVFTVTADANNVERRITFDMLNNPDVIRDVVVFRNGDIASACLSLTAYVLNEIVDVFNPFIIDFSVQIPEVTIPLEDGDVVPRDLSDIPVVSSSGTTNVRVETLKNCNGSLCVPDLRISLVAYRTVMVNGSESSSPVINLGAVRTVFVVTDVLNNRDDAFLATITIAAPSRLLEIGRVSGAIDNGPQLSLSCPTDQRDTEVMDDMDIALVNCTIGNPLPGGVNLRVTTSFIPRSRLIGNEGAVPLRFRVQSVNSEEDATINDGSNDLTGELQIAAVADITLDPVGVVSPEVISYSNNLINETIVNVTQLGPTFTTTFVVRNNGPSTVRTIAVVINWPLRTSTSASADTYSLYPAVVEQSTDSGTTMRCMNTNANPSRLNLMEIMALDDQNNQQGIGQGGKKRKRRSASISFNRQQGRRFKRQAVSTSTDRITETCESSGVSCVLLTCVVEGLQADRTASIDVTAFLDVRSFAESSDRFFIIPTAEVSIIDGDFITQPNPNDGKIAMATVNVIPADAPDLITESEPVPWWVIFLPILAAVIIIAVIAAALWGLGFFKRRKHEELKQRKEELQNLETNGSGPGMSNNPADDGTNM